jgi:hypothetical protein
VSEGTAPGNTAAEVSEEQKKEVRQALEDAPPVTNLPFFEQERKEREQNISLRGWYALSLLAGLGLQIAIVDVVLFGYAWKGVHWRVDPNLIYVWLSATVIEVISVVYVVTRHLFPGRD